MFREIEDSQEENNADKPVSDLLNMSTGSAKTSYLDRDSALNRAVMSQDWLVVPEHGRGLSATREYHYHWGESTKAVPRNFVGAPNVSTTSADGELEHGGFNGNVRNMSVQNVDTRQVKVSYDRGIENNQLCVMSVPKLVVDQASEVQVCWDLILPVSMAATWMPGLLLLVVHTISI